MVFKTDLTSKILGLNPHVVIQPNSYEIDNDFVLNLKKNFKENKFKQILYW